MVKPQNGWLLAGLLLAFSVPVTADTKAGVDAWGRGDYSAAISEWQGPAAHGDADAQFNLGQAYRLGQGVEQDAGRAERLYASAAALGHLQAADVYGLMLFQAGRRAEAMPYVTDAARRGDPRAQYVLGVAHFNGDLVERDWARAYALMTLSQGAGLPQAQAAIAEMDRTIPLEQRQLAAGLAVDMDRDARAARASEFAAAELNAAPQPSDSARSVPDALQLASVAPSAAASRLAIEGAARATGLESPASAGASFAARGDAGVVAAPSGSPPIAPPAPRQAAARAQNPQAAAVGTGPWRVQLGAFSVAGNADRLWQTLSRRSELSGARKLVEKVGGVSRLHAAGFPSRAAAQSACRSLRSAGQDCLVTRG